MYILSRTITVVSIICVLSWVTFHVFLGQLYRWEAVGINLYLLGLYSCFFYWHQDGLIVLFCASADHQALCISVRSYNGGTYASSPVQQLTHKAAWSFKLLFGQSGKRAWKRIPIRHRYTSVATSHTGNSLISDDCLVKLGRSGEIICRIFSN